MDPSSFNYNPDATFDDGSCLFTTPNTYTFSREGTSVLDYQEETVRQLLINDLGLLISGLGQAGAQPLSVTDLLKYYAHKDSDSLMILTPVGSNYEPLDSAYVNIAMNTSLADQVVDLPPVATPSYEIPVWLWYIAIRSQSSALGSPEVYTTAEGLDLLQMVSVSLLSSVIYAHATDSLLLWVDTLDNTDFNTGCNCTDMENAWDRAYGNFGASRNYGAFSAAQLASGQDGSGNFPYVRDDNNDGKIDFTAEYNFPLARLAGEREINLNPSPGFKTGIFSNFLTARAAIAVGPGEEAAIVMGKEEILFYWDQIIAATVIHHLNRVLVIMPMIGSPDYDKYEHNSEWSAMFAYSRMIAYYSNNLIGSPQNVQSQLLDPMGTAPVYAQPGSDEYNSYLATLEGLKADLGAYYQFTAAQLNSW